MSMFNFFLKQGMKRAPFMPQAGPAGRAKALMRAPSISRLVWALFSDPRVPIVQKGIVLILLVLIVSPLDVIQAIPVVGEISDVVMAMFVLEWFIKLAPREVVNEHIVRLGLESKIPLRD